MDGFTVDRASTFQSTWSDKELEASEEQYKLAKIDFFELLDQFKLNTDPICGGRTFILVDRFLRKLKSHKSSSILGDEGVGHGWECDFDRLWKSSFFKSTTGPPALSRDVLLGCTTLFFILFELGHPDLTPVFAQNRIHDTSLPLDRGTIDGKMREKISEHFGGADQARTAEFIEKFLIGQYAWCPVKLDLGIERMDVGEQIMPFYRIKPLASAQRVASPSPHGSRLWVVEVPADLVGDALKAKLPGAKLDLGPQSRDETGRCEPEVVYQFALKTFPAFSFDAFVKERNALKALRDMESVIAYIGWYECVHPPSKPTTSPGEADGVEDGDPCCILLELGICDFNEAMILEAPPNLEREIRKFWEELSGIADALVNIQDFEIDGTRYHGWHGDIKPENILNVLGRYKLADPGEARIRRESTRENKDKAPRALASGGTRTYAAPEKVAYLDMTKPGALKTGVLQTSDVWSLGCVLSVAATYVVLGLQGVRTYTELRVKTITRVKDCTSTAIDAFHNGSEVLPSVTEWHRYLRRAKRGTDGLTDKILDMVDEHMLLPETKRFTATHVAERFRHILRDTKDSLGDFPQLQDLLVEVDRETNPQGDISGPPASNMLSASRENPDEAIDNASPEDVMLQTSEEKLRSIPVKPTAQRSSLQPPAPNQPVRRVSTGSYPIDPSIGRSQSAGERRERGRTNMPSGFGMTPLFTGGNPTSNLKSGFFLPRTPNVQNWLQVEEQLERIGKGRRLSDLRKLRRLSLDSLRRAASRGIRKVEIPIRGKEERDPLEGRFNNRDIIFLVDNGSSMGSHWREARHVIRVLAWRALGYDDDGMELYFTNPATKHSVKQSKDQDVKDFVDAMDYARPLEGTVHKTAIVPKLVKLMNRYAADGPEDSTKKARKKTIIVLTDGCWEGSRDEDVDDLFRFQLKRLQRSYQPDSGDNSLSPMGRDALAEDRPVTVQFVRFGYDPDAKVRLERLDGLFETEGFVDIIDTEPSNGDIYKMLLGSHNKEMDEKTNGANTTTPVASPSGRCEPFAFGENSLMSSPTQGNIRSRSSAPTARVAPFPVSFSDDAAVMVPPADRQTMASSFPGVDPYTTPN